MRTSAQTLSGNIAVAGGWSGTEGGGGDEIDFF